MSKKLQYDGPKLTADEATETLVYHLRMATSLFQIVPDDNNVALIKEIKRNTDDPWFEEPALVWAKKILEVVEMDKD